MILDVPNLKGNLINNLYVQYQIGVWTLSEMKTSISHPFISLVCVLLCSMVLGVVWPRYKPQILMCVLATISILYFYLYAYRRSYLDTHTHTRSHTHCICVYMFIYSLYNTYACSNTYVQCSLYNDGATLPEVPRRAPHSLKFCVMHLRASA